MPDFDKNWFRFLIRYLGVFKDGQPTAREIEKVHEWQGRIMLMANVRWFALFFLTIYGIGAGIHFYTTQQVQILSPGIILSVLCLVAFTTAFNYFIIRFVKEIAYLNGANHAQIAIDSLLVTAVIHLSGGVLSWFWGVYLLVSLEAAYLLGRKKGVLFVSLIANCSYLTVVLAEYSGTLPSVQMPFDMNHLQHDPSYCTAMVLWVSVTNIIVASTGAFLITVMKAREEDLAQLVVMDRMTGLYNRAYFYQAINSEIQRSLRYGHVFSVLLMDIDNFKKYNDTHGHLEGDRMLKAVAQVLRTNIRRKEGEGGAYDIDIPCRYGGEELAVILPETPALMPSLGNMPAITSETYAKIIRSAKELDSSGRAVAERIRKNVAALNLDGRRATLSIGLAVYPVDGATAEELVKSADDALYVAKKNGKNQVVLATPPESLQDELPLFSPAT